MIDGIKFVAESDIAFLFDEAKLMHRKGVFGETFVVYNPSNVGTC